MCKYRYTTYSDIPGNVISFVENVSGERANTLTIKEINDFLNDLDYYYQERQMKLGDFLECQ